MAWRNAKIALTNTVLNFEELIEQKEVPAENLGKIQDALDVWENNKVGLSRVPGMVYIEGAKEEALTEEDYEILRLMMELLKAVLKKELSEEDLVAVSMADVAVVAQQPSTPLATPLDQAGQSKETPKSILKRHAGIPSAVDPHRKRVLIAEFAVVSSETLTISNPSPFTVTSNKNTVLPHGYHTSAENHRQRAEFHRGTPIYVPGVWASGAFGKKADTSFFSTPVDSMERMVTMDLEESQREQVMYERLKIVAGCWVALWWARNVALHVELEELRRALTML